MNAPFSVMGRTAVPRTDARKRKGEHIMAEKAQVIKDLDRVISLIETDSKDIPAE